MTLSDRYVLHGKLGVGGMGAVYRATDRLTGQTVALKRVSMSEYDSSQSYFDDLRLALSREFRTLASLRHPNIINVIDYGFDEHHQPFFTMELLQGNAGKPPLTVVEATRAASTQTATELILHLLHALVYLHRNKIVHHDLKPENILVAQDQLRIVDFGLSVSPHKDDHAVSGTLPYMSPELLTTGVASVQSDLYAVGVLLYQIVAGVLPFDPPDIDAILDVEPDAAILNDHALAPVILRLLRKDPAERYESAEMLLQEVSKVTGVPIPPESAEIRESFLRASAFVGRDTEFSWLTQRLTDTINGKGSAWLVGGESGVGKSRLLDELRNHAMVSGALVLRGQEVEGASTAYGLWQEPLRRLLLSVRIDDLQASILKDIVPEIEKLLGFSVPYASRLDGAAQNERLTLTIIEVLKRSNDPVLLLLEDLHWVSNGFEVLRQLAAYAPNGRLMVIGSYRDDERPDLPTLLPEMGLISLPRLDNKAINELSTSMLGQSGTRAEVVELLQRETEGNALFMVEIVRALAEEVGSLNAVGQITLHPGIMSGGIRHILRRRLGRVPQWGQVPLRTAAIIGRTVDRQLLLAIHPELNFDEWLTACANVAVLNIADGNWRFSHDKLRETVLADMGHDERRDGHRVVAFTIEQVYGNVQRYHEILLEHWYAAGERDKTIEYTLKVADYLLNYTADGERVRRLIEHVMRMGVEGAAKARLLVLLGEVGRISGDYTVAYEHFAASLADADPKIRADALNGMAWIKHRTGDYPNAELYANEALEIAATCGLADAQASAHNVLGALHMSQGRSDRACQEYDFARKTYEQLGDQRGIASSLQNAGYVLLDSGDTTSAREQFEASLRICRDIGDRRGVAANLFGIGNSHYHEAQYTLALPYVQESLTIYTAVKDRAGSSNCLRILAAIAELQGFYDLSRQHHEAWVEMLHQDNNLFGMAQALYQMTVMLMRQGDMDAAYARGKQSLELFRTINAVDNIEEVLIDLATVQLARSDDITALQYAEESYRSARERNNIRRLGHSLSALSLVSLYRGDFEKVLQYSYGSVHIAESINDTFGIITALCDAAKAHIRMNDLQPARHALHRALSLARSANVGTMFLYVLCAVAHLIVASGNAVRAAMLMGLIRTHFAINPIVEQYDFSVVKRYILKKIDEEQFNLLMEVGAEDNFDDKVSEILNDLALEF
jgi:tetratricopeptide (TPR) repeat protein